MAENKGGKAENRGGKAGIMVVESTKSLPGGKVPYIPTDAAKKAQKQAHAEKAKHARP